MKANSYKFLKVIVILLLVNVVSNFLYFRKDFTADHRYTLNSVSKRMVYKFNEPVDIKVYLKGDYPLDFKRLAKATEQHLDELKRLNNQIRYQFINPKGIEEELTKKGMEPSRLSIEEEESVSEMLIFPYAEITYKNKSSIIPLLLNSGNSQEEQLQKSIENLEYAFSNGFNELQQNKKKSIAVLRSNGTLEDLYLYDILSNLSKKYNLAPFTLHPENISPDKVLNDLKNYDLLLLAKPTEKFSENDKFIIDQYIMNGGKTIWTIDQAQAEMDSLQTHGQALFMNRDLNITDLLFSYGVRVNFDLVKDLYSSKIAVATGNVGNKVQFQEFLWHYYPLVTPNDRHPISKNIEAVHLKFPTAIDTLKNNVQKTVLLQSSTLSKTEGLPTIVSLESLAQKIKPEDYQSTSKILGVLLEGTFPSSYAFRTQPFTYKALKESKPTKMLVIADGDILANQVNNGQPTALDRDKWTGQHFGNKDLMLNAVDYMLDDIGIIALRSKDLNVTLLNKKTIAQQKTFWQGLNIFLPVLLIGLFALVYNFLRKKKYAF